MPKIIQELREKILAASRTRLLTEGYAALSLRGIAQDCSIAVGTIYNYFKDKNTLIASVMLEDWLEALETMERVCAQAETATEGYVGIY
ncbi:MAG: TetR/AcrR family transcriptional regulator, partial [Lachnospiraceae bacterium]|nr:TetR/AcrR family transcriptional regulator [Lachnospiraceae bacterium]